MFYPLEKMKTKTKHECSNTLELDFVCLPLKKKRKIYNKNKILLGHRAMGHIGVGKLKSRMCMLGKNHVTYLLPNTVQFRTCFKMGSADFAMCNSVV